MISPLGHGCGCGFRVDMEDASDGEVVRGVVCVGKGSVGEIVLGCGREQHGGGETRALVVDDVVQTRREGAALDRRALGGVVGGVRRRKPVRGEKAGESNAIQAGVFMPRRGGCVGALVEQGRVEVTADDARVAADAGEKVLKGRSFGTGFVWVL